MKKTQVEKDIYAIYKECIELANKIIEEIDDQDDTGFYRVEYEQFKVIRNAVLAAKWLTSTQKLDLIQSSEEKAAR